LRQDLGPDRSPSSLKLSDLQHDGTNVKGQTGRPSFLNLLQMMPQVTSMCSGDS